MANLLDRMISIVQRYPSGFKVGRMALLTAVTLYELVLDWALLKVFSHPIDQESRRVVRYAILKRMPMLSAALDEEQGEIKSNSAC